MESKQINIKRGQSVKDLVIIGAGGFARETAWIAERMNKQRFQWNILGFVDKESGGEMRGYPVFGENWLERYEKQLYFVCGIGSGNIRQSVWNRFLSHENLCPAMLVDPSAVIGETCTLGEGSILCAGCVLTDSVKIGQGCIINLNCTLGHDSVLEDFCTIHPGSSLSGNVTIGRCSEIGTGTAVIQGKHIGCYSILGAGSVVVRDIPPYCTAVGVPAKPVKMLDTAPQGGAPRGGGNKYPVFRRSSDSVSLAFVLRAAG